MIDEIINLGTTTQVWLASGYLAYNTAYAGYQSHHKTRETVFITAVFVALSSVSYSFGHRVAPWLAYALAAVVPILLAVIWRRWGRRSWMWIMEKGKVHRENGIASTWECIVQTDRSVDQISVHLQDGRTLYLNDRPKYVGQAAWDGLYFGSDGSIIMIVEEEDLPDGSVEQREGILSDWGTRLTFVPASQIVRVNIRMS